MADLLFVVITIAFFVLCVGYVKVCDRIIGPDPSPEAGRRARARVRRRGGAGMTAVFASQTVDNYVGLAIAVCMVVLLVLVLVFPERF